VVEKCEQALAYEWALSQFPPCHGSKYASQAEQGEDDKGDRNALYQLRILLYTDLCPADEDAEDYRGNAHADHHAEGAHGADRSRCDTEKPFFNGTHDGIGIGGRKEGKTDAQQDETADDISQGCGLI